MFARDNKICAHLKLPFRSGTTTAISFSRSDFFAGNLFVIAFLAFLIAEPPILHPMRSAQDVSAGDRSGAQSAGPLCKRPLADLNVMSCQ
jgi:hypothetical protein